LKPLKELNYLNKTNPKSISPPEIIIMDNNGNLFLQFQSASNLIEEDGSSSSSMMGSSSNGPAEFNNKMNPATGVNMVSNRNSLEQLRNYLLQQQLQNQIAASTGGMGMMDLSMNMVQQQQQQQQQPMNLSFGFNNNNSQAFQNNQFMSNNMNTNMNMNMMNMTNQGFNNQGNNMSLLNSSGIFSSMGQLSSSGHIAGIDSLGSIGTIGGMAGSSDMSLGAGMLGRTVTAPPSAFQNQAWPNQAPTSNSAVATGTANSETVGAWSATSAALLGQMSSEASKKSNKKKQDKDKPRKALSAYNIFFKEERNRILEEIPDSEAKVRVGGRKRKKKPHGKIGFEKLAQMIGQRWRDLDEATSAIYREKAAADAIRYKEEMDVYLENERKNERNGSAAIHVEPAASSQQPRTEAFMGMFQQMDQAKRQKFEV
jgi:hypothetical protein